MRGGGRNSFERVAHHLRIEYANRAPHFIALCVEENKSWGEFKIINSCKFPANRFLNIYADDMNGSADGNSTLKFFFKLVHDGLNLGAGNSVGRLKFEKYRGASPDHILHNLCIVHERCLARM